MANKRGTAAQRRERQRAITEYVNAAASRTVEEIAAQVGISPMTAYRDIAQLEAQGLLRRDYGTVTAAATQGHEAASAYRMTRDVEAKERLAKAAAELIGPGSALFMDDSSTGIYLAKLLADRAGLTVVTNYNPVARVLEDAEDVRLLATGGVYERWADAYLGPSAVRMIEGMRADLAFMSASAIVNGVVYHPTEDLAEIKRAMLRSAAKKVLYADASKFSRTALHEVVPVSSFDVVILEKATPAEALEGIGESVGELILV
ncbi:MAG: DeoR/GlpR family DNA-binding transcription regulator [Propionibacteriaceae bacterium]|jgi:DeoR/GlpR family transcriptional regulator of sugar metabolism|nr:DeoR/GlpR family DNA-binding transcription regulator [Propionibacteriaceae bacterium]